MTLKICSFNCRGIKGSVCDLSKLTASVDILCLQETWLLPNELSILNGILPDMSGTGVSAVKLSDGLLCGRPYGGVAILWQKSLGYRVHCVNSDLDWCIAATVTDDDGNSFTVVNVYLPCDSYANIDSYLDYLGKLLAFVSDIIGPYIILGDFNCNPNDKNSPCGKILREFIDDCDFALYDRCLPVDSYTFVSDAWHTTSWLDHCIGPRLLLGLVDHCKILYDSYNSDHYPLMVSVLMPDCNSVPSSADCDELCISYCNKLPKIVLNKISQHLLSHYKPLS